MSSASEKPLVSVICFCKDRVSFMRRSMESVLNQTYENLEFVVQDGASTDGTLELLQEYARRDPRVKIASEKDSGPAEAYWKVLQRCTGDYIATCLSDEELVPDALERAVDWFAANPAVGAFTCDGHTTDENGVITGDFNAGDFDFVSYLFGKYCPFWPGSFFRRQALLDIGLDRDEGWNKGCLEFEIWCRLAREHRVQYIPTPISKYAVHPGQLSNTPVNFYEHIDNRLKLIRDMFSADGFFGMGKAREISNNIDHAFAHYDDVWFRELEAQINHLSQFQLHAGAHKLFEHEKEFARRAADLQDKLVDLHAHSVKLSGYAGLNPGLDVKARRRQVTRALWKALEALRGVSPDVEPNMPALRWKLRLQKFLIEHLFSRLKDPLRPTLRLAQRLTLGEHAAPQFAAVAARHRQLRLARMYDTTARVYESRAQFAEAMAMWARAEPLHNSALEAHACQQALKDPGATYESLAQLQQRWVDRHLRVDPAEPKPAFDPYVAGRKVRVGYYCSFMDSDTIRYIMQRVMRAHDRSKFYVIGYAPSELPDDMRAAFDLAVNTAGLSDDAFAQRVRADRVDVFIEMSGFSFAHRFGAMAKRCAPVQISYLNHFATSRVPNVDYVLSDETCTPYGADAQETFTETIYRLPGCLLRYDYTDGNSPPVSDLPAITNGFVTFGCFGSANKINSENIALWARVMHRVPGSKILLQHSQFDPPDNRRFITNLFRRQGISSERVVIRPGATREGILNAYGEVDISFDTWPYCGGNTLAESLWQGVPAVSLKGAMMCGRYGASLLEAAGLPQLIAHSRDEYIEISTNLASDLGRLQGLRRSLRQLYATHGLNDSAGFARILERAYVHMLEALAAHVSRPEGSKIRTTEVPVAQR